MSSVAVIYARKSPDPNHRNAGGHQRSVGEQEHAGRARAAGEGWAIHAVELEDRAVSASRFARTRGRAAWDRVQDHIRNPSVTVLWLWESSRGDRKLATWAALLDLCREHKTRLYIETHERYYDMDNGRDWRTLADEGVDSATEVERTSQRVRRTKAAQLRAGKPDGRVAFGFERVYDPQTRALIEQRPHPEQAPVVREIYRRLASGTPVSEVVRDLNARGVPASTPGRVWTRNQVVRIGSNPVYISERHRDGQVYPQSWPPLVDRDTWFAVRRVLSDPSRRTTRPGRAKYLLSYLARCDVCTEQLAAVKRGVNSDRYYVCPTGCVGVKVDWLDGFLRDLVVERVSRPDVYGHLTATDDGAVVAARSELEALRGRLDATWDQVADGRLSPEGAASIEARLRPLIEAAELRARTAAVPPQLRALLDPAGDVRSLWDRSSVAARKEVIRALLTSVRVRRARPGRARALDPGRVVVEWA